MKKIILILIILIAGFVVYTKSKDGSLDLGSLGGTTEEGGVSYTSKGKLKDVSGGTAEGLVQTGFNDEPGLGASGKFDLLATFEGLKPLAVGENYEGFLLDATGRYISTGNLVQTSGMYKNLFTSGEDFRDFPTYIVTVEKNDGNPEPGEKVLEGTIK